MFAVNGILFNHESERRGENSVTRKITLAAARIAQGFQDKLLLGKSEFPARLGICQRLCGMYVADSATRYARRLCYSHRRISHCTPNLPPLLSRKWASDLHWEGEGVNRRGIDTATGKVLVEVDPKYFRPGRGGTIAGRSYQKPKRYWDRIPARLHSRNW